MEEEYEIIYVPNKGRAIKNNKTKRIYYSEFQIIEEKNKEIERLNNIIDYIEGMIEHIISESYYENENIDNTKFGFVLEKIKELKEKE